MIAIHETKVTVCLLLFALLCLTVAPATAQDDEPNEALIEMITELVNDADPDMRALGLQQVRSEAPGEAATKKFAALLPNLPSDGQAGLLEALGDRKDPTARPAALDMLKSKEEIVRAAALRALGPLGTAADVSLLSQKAAEGSDLEKKAAEESMVRLQGDDINSTILAEMEKGKTGVRVGLLAVLAARNAKESLPAVLKSAGHSEATVRLAALEALRFLANEKNAPEVVKALKAAKDDTETRKAKLALLGVCSRGGEACVAPIVAGMADASGQSRIALLHALARAGGDKALEAVVANVENDDEAVRNEAVRMLSNWSDAAAVPHLSAMAKKDDNQRYQILAIRGLVRLASPQKDRPADLKLLGEAMGMAKRLQEKKLVIGALSGADSSEAIEMAMPLTDDPALAGQARFAVVLIAGKMLDDQDTATAALEKMCASAKNPLVPVVAMQGFVSLAVPKVVKDEPEKPANMKLLGRAMKLAKEPQEKEVLVDALGKIGNAKALALVMPLTDDPDVADAAGMAAAQIAEIMAEANADAAMKAGDKEAVKKAMEKLSENAKNKKVSQKAKKVLASLESL